MLKWVVMDCAREVVASFKHYIDATRYVDDIKLRYKVTYTIEKVIE